MFEVQGKLGRGTDGEKEKSNRDDGPHSMLPNQRTEGQRAGDRDQKLQCVQAMTGGKQERMQTLFQVFRS